MFGLDIMGTTNISNKCCFVLYVKVLIKPTAAAHTRLQSSTANNN